MTREFVFMPEFEMQWKKLKFNDLDLRDVEVLLCNNPTAGPVMKGTGGLRKLRWAKPGNKGKSGGCRILYVDFDAFEKIYMITCFAKNKQVNLDATQKQLVKGVINQIKTELRGQS